MNKEFKYMKEGLTSDMVKYLMLDYNLSMQEALDTLYESDTYTKICNPATGLYYQGSKYVYTYLLHELRTGKAG